MPDTTIPEYYQSRMTGLERKYLRFLNRGMRDMRLDLLDVVARIGHTSPSLPREITRAVDGLQRTIAGQAGLYGRGILNRTQEYIARYIRLSARVGLLGPQATAASFFGPLIGNALARATGQLSQSPAIWANSIRSTILAEANRLSLSEPDPDKAIPQLLGVQLFDGRASAWRKARNSLQLGASNELWGVGNLLVDNFIGGLQTQYSVEYKRQAIAAIDERTTETCLLVHGQVKPLDEPFKLRGTPRFADEIMRPPFHHYCRTAQSLYNPLFERFGTPTNVLVNAAQAELLAREQTGRRVEIHPASATSRR